jgi:hypothetical protein
MEYVAKNQHNNHDNVMTSNQKSPEESKIDMRKVRASWTGPRTELRAGFKGQVLRNGLWPGASVARVAQAHSSASRRRQRRRP